MASTWQSFYFAPGLRRFQHASAQYSWGQEIGESSAHWVYQTCLFGHWVRVLPTNHGGYLKKHILHDITKYFWGYDLAWLGFFVAFIAHRMRIPSKSNDSQLSFVFFELVETTSSSSTWFQTTGKDEMLCNRQILFLWQHVQLLSDLLCSHHHWNDVADDSLSCFEELP